MKTFTKLLPCLALFAWASIPSLFAAPKDRLDPDLTALLRWNEVAVSASATDHTPPGPGETRVFREQLGPGRASRAMAIVHIAMFDAANAIRGDYASFSVLPPVPRGSISMAAAVSQAAHDTLVALFPAQAATFDALLVEDLESMKHKTATAKGVQVGQQAAAACLLVRADDGSAHSESFLGLDYFPSDLPGHWRGDPISQLPIVLGAHWYECAPFVVPSTSYFRVPPPPAMTSPEYAAAYDEVKRLGGDGVVTPTERTLEQTIIGIYWGYDGTAGLGAPPNLFNRITVQISRQMESGALETARLLALVNLAMADATLNVWESKYYYDFWRPVTGIRESDPGTGPTGLGDGNPATIGDPTFTPLGAPASNLSAPDFTPPFPAYPSGHAGMGGATFQTLRRFYGTDNIAFSFVSDEFNGVTRDNDGSVRPLIVRHFSTLSEAEEENAQSRIYLGVHWQFDKLSVGLGREVANYVFDHAITPRPPRR